MPAALLAACSTSPHHPVSPPITLADVSSVMSQHYVYLLASRSRTLYVGMTKDLARRLREHRTGRSSGAFSARYDVHQLVYFEVASSPYAAVTREKEIKTWSRERKMELVESMNPGWEDLATSLGLVEKEG